MPVNYIASTKLFVILEQHQIKRTSAADLWALLKKGLTFDQVALDLVQLSFEYLQGLR